MTKPSLLILILLTPALLTAQGYFYSEGTVTVNNGSSIEIKGNVQLEKEVFGDGMVILNGDNPQMVSGSEVKMNNLRVTNSADIFLENNLYIGDSLLINSGILYSQDNAIFMADNTYHTGNQMGYISTNGNGRVHRKIDNNSFTFHMGYGSEYFPFTLTEMGATDTFSMAAWYFLPDDGTQNGTAVNSHVALISYNLQDNHIGGNDIALQMQWKDSRNAADFVQPYAIGIYYNGSGYEELDNCPTNVSQVNPNVISYSGIGHTGTFGIGDSIYLSNIPEANINPGDTSICNGSTIVFTATPANSDAYLWNTGDSTQSITAFTTGTYFVDITDSTGCIYRSNEVTLTLLALPSTPVITQFGNQLSVPTGYAAYQWLFNGDTITGANSNLYIASLSGVYSVLVTGSNGCTAGSDGYTYIPTGIETPENSAVFITGSDDQILITGTGTGPYQIQVLDVLGRLMYTGKAYNGYINLPVPTGIYLVNVSSGSETFSRKILIK